MLVRQFIDEGLGIASYIVASEETGMAAVIDPQRDVDQYLSVADGLGLRIAYVLETHLHADFISGARELHARVRKRGGGALTIAGSTYAGLEFPHQPLKEGDTLSLGDLTIGVLETSGHSPEHISFTLTPEKASWPEAVFTGGSLIVGGAARTDLLGEDMTEPLARSLHETIQHRLLQLPDDTLVYPTHGAGSFCIAPHSSERVSTIGQERASNPLAQARSPEETVELALSNLPSYPTYFRLLRPINRKGPRVFGGLPELPAVGPGEVRRLLDEGAVAVDLRPPDQYAASHIPGAYAVPTELPVGIWVGWVVPFGSPLVLVHDQDEDLEPVVRALLRVGYDDLRGYLKGGMSAWREAGLTEDRTPVLSASKVWSGLQDGKDVSVLDVRWDPEWNAGHIPEATHVEAGALPDVNLEHSEETPIVVHCGHVSRATVALSVLERKGYENLSLLEGGYSGWVEAGYEVVKG